MFLAKLVAKPPQLVPSMRDVFGTDAPNPFDFDGPQTVAQQQTQANLIETRAATPQVPKATTVWAKTGDLGIVERKSTPVGHQSVSGASLQLKENTAPQAPDANFPDASQAVLIEGFVFPSHKAKLAKKVEKLLQKDESRHQSELVVSDSDESGSESEDMDSNASSASFELSDFDDDELITLDELSLFSNLWRLLSSWITHETNLLVAGLPIPVVTDEETSTTTTAPNAGAEGEARALRYRMTERRNAFALMLNRPMPQAALKIKLAADRYMNQKIADIVETFVLRDAIDARNSHQVRTLYTNGGVSSFN